MIGILWQYARVSGYAAFGFASCATCVALGIFPAVWPVVAVSWAWVVFFSWRHRCYVRRVNERVRASLDLVSRLGGLAVGHTAASAGYVRRCENGGES